MTTRRWLVVVLAGAAVLIFGRIHLPLLEPEEARNADVAREMAAANSWLVPLLDGQPYLDKPPLLYWLIAVGDGWFGPSNASARLVTALSAWLTVLVVAWWGWRIVGPAAGVVAAGVLTLSGDFIYRAPMLTMNGLLGLFVTGALAAGHVSLAKGTRWLWWLSGLLVAAGILVKGPVAVALVVPPLVLARWVDPGIRRPGFIEWIIFVLAAVLPAAPWFIALAIREPAFFEYFFWKHNVERFLRPFDHAKPFWAYLPQVALGLLPWTALLIGYIYFGRRPSRPAAFGLMAAGWGLLFFSLSGSKRPAYIVPIEPAFAFAVGLLLTNDVVNSARASRLRLLAGATAVILAAGVFVWLPRYSDQFGRPVSHRPKSSVGIPNRDGHSVKVVDNKLNRDDFLLLAGEGVVIRWTRSGCGTGRSRWCPRRRRCRSRRRQC